MSKPYIGGVIGSSALDGDGIFSLGSLSGDGASSTRPARKWGGITGRSITTSGGGGAGGDANWNDVVLLLDGSSTTDVTGTSTVTPSASGYTTNNTTGAKFNQYIDFQNSGYLNVAFPSALGVGDEPFTVECWAYLDAISDDGIFELYHSGSVLDGTTVGSNSIAFYANTGVFKAYAYGSLNSNVASASTGQWYHLAVVYDGTNLNYYVDGTSGYSVAKTVPAGGWTNMGVGGYYTTTYVMDGRIEGLRVTKGVARYTADFTPPTEAFPTVAGGGGGTPVSAWTDRIGSETFTKTGTVTDVTTDPEHKSFADGAYIDFSGGSTTADMRVQFRFRRDSAATFYKGLYTRASKASGTEGSVWTNGGQLTVHDTGWKFNQYAVSYDTWYWLDVEHSGTTMIVRLYDAGTEDTVGTHLYTNAYTLGAGGVGDYSTVRLMAGWDNTWAGQGDLGVVRINVGATDENWTSEFYPYDSTVGGGGASLENTGIMTLAEHYQSKL